MQHGSLIRLFTSTISTHLPSSYLQRAGSLKPRECPRVSLPHPTLSTILSGKKQGARSRRRHVQHQDQQSQSAIHQCHLCPVTCPLLPGTLMSLILWLELRNQALSNQRPVRRNRKRHSRT